MYTGVSREARRAPPEDGDVEDVPLVDRGGSSGSDEDVEAPSAGQRGWPSTSGIDGTSWGDRTGRKDASSSSSSATLSTDGPAKGGCAGAEAALPVAWRGRRRADDVLTLHEASASVPVSLGGGLWKQLRGYLGIGVVVSVGYMDPGNWASDLGSGSRFGYALLFVVLLSSLAAMLLQHLALKVGVVAERDLARACRDAYGTAVSRVMWVAAELAIVATDLAEVIGSAVALNLLTGMPIWAGVLLTSADVVLLLALGGRSPRILEGLIVLLTAVIAGAFVFNVCVASPDWGLVARGLLPSKVLFTDVDAMLLGVSILGAVVMPHSLYLHSSLIQTRAYPRSEEGKRHAVRYGTIDSNVALTMALGVNAGILVVAATAFHYRTDNPTVAGIEDAYRLLDPALGSRMASTVFAIALLASGQNSTITGTLSGQIVMEGFVNLRVAPWVRRVVTRLLAIVPAALTAGLAGNQAVNMLLVLSQVFLSLTLPFAVVPLCHFTGSAKHMGAMRNSLFVSAVAWFTAIVILALNIFLIVLSVRG